MSSRRKFIKGVGVVGAGAGLLACSGGVVPAAEPGGDAGTDSTSVDSGAPGTDTGTPPEDAGPYVESGLAPVLRNFRVENDSPNRVYFDSTKPLSAATTSTGFVISYREIAAVFIREGDTDGHYFEVSIPLSFWDNNTIRYEGGSDLKDVGDKEPHPFTLQYIANGISEPSATENTFYVSTEGSDANDGASEADAFLTIGHAIDAATAGSTIHVKAGLYVSTDSTYVTGNGTPDAPIRIIGYRSSPGDISEMYYSFEAGSVAPDLDPSEMPLMDGEVTSRSGLYVLGADYVIIKNIQFKRYGRGIGCGENIGLLVENCISKDMYGENGTEEGGGFSIGTENTGEDYAPTYYRVLNSISVNAGMTNIHITGSACLVSNCKTYCDKSGGQLGSDYHINVGGDNNIVLDSTAETLNNSINASSHGIGAKATEWNYDDWGMHTRYNLFENIYVKTGSQEGIYSRNTRCNFNVFRNCEVVGFGTANGDGIGISNQTGARNNTYERIHLHDLSAAFLYKGGTESGTDPEENITDGNMIKNSVVTNVARVILTERNLDIVNTFSNNLIVNCTIRGAEMMMRAGDDNLDYYALSGNKIVNCILVEVGGENYNSDQPTFQEMFALEHCDTWDCWQPNGEPLSGEGNLSVDPRLDGDLVPSNEALKTGATMDGLEYDMNDRERPSPPTIGGVEIDS